MEDIDALYIQNKESLHVLSKFNRWITVTPTKRDRTRPLENVKLTSLESSKIIPYWMQIKPEVKVTEIFRPMRVDDNSLRGVGEVILIDKDQINAKMSLMESNYVKSDLYS